jgi:hypothetical protein
VVPFNGFGLGIDHGFLGFYGKLIEIHSFRLSEKVPTSFSEFSEKEVGTFSEIMTNPDFFLKLSMGLF